LARAGANRFRLIDKIKNIEDLEQAFFGNWIFFISRETSRHYGGGYCGEMGLCSLKKST